MADQDSRKRLGRGLAALIGDVEQPGSSGENNAARTDRLVPIDQLRPNLKNPRRQFHPDEMDELAQSIAKHGVVQPILVRTAPDVAGDPARFEIIAGERRWRAAQQANLHTVPVVIREAADHEVLELAIIENVQRADLNPVEEAAGYQQLMEEHGYSQAELGETLGKSRSHIANTLRLLRLPDEVRAMIVAGELSAGHARTLVTADNPAALARRIIDEGLSVRQAEALQQHGRRSGTGSGRASADPGKSADIRALEREMEDQLGLKVSIAHREGGAGSIRIEYRNIDQLDGFCRRLQQG